MHQHARQYATTFALAAIALVLTVPINSAFMFLLFFPFVVVSLIYNAITAVRKPDRRRLSLVRIVVWLFVPAIIGAVHWHWYEASRSDADIAVAAVLKYKEQTGRWPQTLQEAGIADTRFGRRWMLGYLCDDQRPFMFYAATFVIFDTYTYDFGARHWEFTPD